MLNDPWLNRWLPLVQERAGGGPVLEIGCGHGDDTATLVCAGLPVHAFDASAAAVGITRLRVPSARIERRDLRDSLPDHEGGYGVIVASLCLHYFAWSETVVIVDRIRAAMRPGGAFLCRLNSTEDDNFGASGHPEIETNFYSVKGEPKRFFDREAIESLFAANWNMRSMAHLATIKYLKKKTLWELVLETRP